MGYDIECIIDIHTYPGEYFCPVCRTLVYPSEALQSQCTHLYCKPCLSYVANGTKACPYDGYLVTESDSKRLVDSDKTLAENIGKVKVHCLFCRSGCTWMGTLSESTSHIAGCTFGNSPVVCNRCQIQIVHRQVHEHAQVCSHAHVQGSYEAQQGIGAIVVAPGSGTTSATTTVEGNQSVTQAQIPQNVAATPLPAQNHNQQVNASSQATVVAPVAVPTPEQWYQQQYQQYYQQQAGYYQHPDQPYYPMQQQPFQQFQQTPLHVQGQHQTQAHTQTPQLVHPQQPLQMQPQPLTMQQPHFQPYMQGQAQPTAQVHQSQPQLPPQALPQVQAQVHAPVQPHPPLRPQAYIPPHGVPLLQGQPAPYAQYPQVPQYQQPAVQMHHPQVSQALARPQLHPQPPSQPPPQSQTSNQMNAQIQPQAQQYITQTQPYFRPPPPLNQPNAAAPQPQVSLPSVPPVSGHHAYQQPQPAPHMQSGLPQQHALHPHPSSGPLHPVQAHGQVPQMRPPYPPGPFPQQQSSTMVPQHNQVPGILPGQYQQFPSHGQQPTHQLPHPPVLQPPQQTAPQQYAQQQPSLAPFQSQLNQQGHFPEQRPPGPPLPFAPLNPQQSQNYAGRPVMPSSGMHPHTNQQSSGGIGPVPHPSPTQLGSKPNVMEQETRLPSKGLAEKGSEVESVKGEEVGKHETVLKNGGNAAKDGLVKPIVKPEDQGLGSSLEQASGGKSFKAGIQGGESCNEENNMLADSDSIKLVDQRQEMKLPKSAGDVAGPSSTNFGQQSHMTVSASSTEGNLPSKSDGSHLQRPHAQLPGQPPVTTGAPGPGMLRHSGQPFNPTERREPAYFGPPQNSFESHRGPPSIPLPDQRGIIGRAPVSHFEGPFGPHHLGRPSETTMVKDQRSVEGGPTQSYGSEPTFLRMNGGLGQDSSMFGSRDETLKAFSREHLNPFPVDPAQTLDRAPGSSDKAPHGPNYDAGSKFEHDGFASNSRFLPPHGRMDNFGPGPEFGQHHMRNFATRSPDREYRGVSPRGFSGPSIFPRGTSAFDSNNGRDAHKFGEGSRAFNQSSDPANPFHDTRFPPLPSHLRRGHLDGPGNLRFDEHMPPRPLHDHNRRNDVFGQDGPSHLMRGDFSGPGHLSGHFNAADISGPGSYHSRPRSTEMGGPGNFSGVRNNLSGPGFPNATHFVGGVDSFDPSRNTRPISSGWCRICKVDCETVEGLDMHSQTREHQEMAMDMVKKIKQQNKRKQRPSANYNKHVGGKARKFGHEFRGNKP